MNYKELKRLAGYTSLHSDCTVERFDGIDLDAVLEPRLLADRIEMLDNADIDLLEKVDVASELSYEPGIESTVINLPDDYRRLVRIRLAGWKRPAEIIDRDSGDVRVKLTANEFGLPGIEHPLAIRSGRRYELWPGVPAGMPQAVAIVEAVAIKM